MKITRGQLRALVDRTEGFVDELECELEVNEHTAVLKFHHIAIEAMKDGSYQVIARDGNVIAAGAVEPQTNQAWGDKVRRKTRRRGFGT